jgi:serralysin
MSIRSSTSRPSAGRKGANPNALFDTNGYLAAYGDVAAANINPLDHYNVSGWQEGRDPSVNFDTTDHLSHYTDIANAHINPLIHFLQYGQAEGRSAFADGHFG